VLTPRILGKITHLRNRLEHDFATPSKRDVEDALDVATLFVSYAELVRVPTMNWTLASKQHRRHPTQTGQPCALSRPKMEDDRSSSPQGSGRKAIGFHLEGKFKCRNTISISKVSR
jgi:hypothetical protein